MASGKWSGGTQQLDNGELSTSLPPCWDPSECDNALQHITSTPHSTTRKTTNYPMLGRKLRLSDQLTGHTLLLEKVTVPQYNNTQLQ